MLSEKLVNQIAQTDLSKLFPAEFKVIDLMIKNMTEWGGFTRPFSWIAANSRSSHTTVQNANDMMERMGLVVIEPHPKYGRIKQQNTYKFDFRAAFDIPKFNQRLMVELGSKKASAAILKIKKAVKKTTEIDLICSFNAQIAKAEKIILDATKQSINILYKNKNNIKINNKKNKSPKKNQKIVKQVKKSTTFEHLTDRSWAEPETAKESAGSFERLTDRSWAEGLKLE